MHREPGRDHPRLRGEHVLVVDGLPEIPGSSPPARGAQPSQGGVSRSCGIIPACAGSTLVPEFATSEYRGSSPPARGALSYQ